MRKKVYIYVHLWKPRWDLHGSFEHAWNCSSWKPECFGTGRGSGLQSLLVRTEWCVLFTSAKNRKVSNKTRICNPLYTLLQLVVYCSVVFWGDTTCVQLIKPWSQPQIIISQKMYQQNNAIAIWKLPKKSLIQKQRWVQYSKTESLFIHP